MGSPKFQIAGMSFPISRKTKFSFEVMPTTSGGTLIRHPANAIVDVLHGPGAKRAKKIRIDVQQILGRGKKIILYQDMVRIGDRIFKFAGLAEDEPRRPERTKGIKPTSPKRSGRK